MAVPEAISVKHLKALHSKPLQRSSTCFFDKEGSSHRGARTKQPTSHLPPAHYTPGEGAGVPQPLTKYAGTDVGPSPSSPPQGKGS